MLSACRRGVDRSRPLWGGRLGSAGPALMVGSCAFAVYMGNGMPLPTGDTVPGRLLPISMLVEHDLDMDEFAESIGPGKRYCMITRDGRKLSSYPLGAAFTALPIYAIGAVVSPGLFTEGMRPYFKRRFGDESRDTVASRMEDRAAALITTLSVIVLWLLARSRLGVWAALSLTVAFGCGTSLFSSTSQALWSHGPSCLALMLMLFLLMSPREHWALLFLAGACAGWAFFCRATNAVPIAILGPWILGRHWKHQRWTGFAAGLVVVLFATSWLNLHLYGQLLGGAAARARRMEQIEWEALMGLLFSPSRGLFVYSPFLLFAVVLGALQLGTRPKELGGMCLLGGVATVLLYSAWPKWGGGFSFGPRLLTDVIPLLMIPLIQGMRTISHPAKP
ncbi:MAG: hypothetical protein O2923_06380 [Verrucomicrobia bacterium]|nr:hypothetical protein [Verrucomicrobiota bacterium]